MESVVLSEAIVAIAQRADWGVVEPDIIHTNDWQTGLVPLYLKRRPDLAARKIASVHTIHNMAHQGLFPDYLHIGSADEELKVLLFRDDNHVLRHADNFDGIHNTVSVKSLLNVDDWAYHNSDEGLEYHGMRSLMKGMVSADKLTGVSEGNMHELMRPEHEGGTAFGFDGIIRRMWDMGKFWSVFNGVDVDPATAPHLQTSGYTPISPAMPRKRSGGQKSE